MGDTHGEPPDGKWLRDDWTQRAFESRSMCPGQGRVKASPASCRPVGHASRSAQHELDAGAEEW